MKKQSIKNRFFFRLLVGPLYDSLNCQVCAILCDRAFDFDIQEIKVTENYVVFWEEKNCLKYCGRNLSDWLILDPK